MDIIERAPCPRCGELAAIAGLLCPHCRGSLAVDVVARSAFVDARARYLAARAVARLGPPAVPFLELNRTLAAPGGVLARHASRLFAERVVAAIASAGGRADLRSEAQEAEPVSASPSPKRGLLLRRSMRVAAGSVLAVALFWLAFTIWFTLRTARRMPGETGKAGLVAFGPITASEVAERALASTVAIRCRETVGTGFFVTEELLATNYHVLCREGESPEIVFRDGRKLRGRLHKENEALDLALVRVPGAHARRLPVGDATEIHAGEHVLTVGSPVGLEFTVARGIVSNADRQFMGIAYLQLDLNVNPGNSGGPLIDESTGTVVGVVSMAVSRAQGLGLALPINYLYEGRDALGALREGPHDVTAWTNLLGRVRKAEQEEIGEIGAAFAKPGLARCILRSDGRVIVIVLRRSRSLPLPEKLTFGVRKREQIACEPSGTIGGWTLIGTDGEVPGVEGRYLRWLQKHGLGRNLYAGSGILIWERCPPPQTLLGAELVLPDADPTAQRTVISAEE